MAKGSGMIHPNPFNEVESKDPNKADSDGIDLYFGGYDEVLKNHAQETGPMAHTPNSDASHDLLGGPAPGEPNPGGMGGHAGGRGDGTRAPGGKGRK